MRISFKIKDERVVLCCIDFDNDDTLNGKEGKEKVLEYLKEQFKNNE